LTEGDNVGLAVGTVDGNRDGVLDGFLDGMTVGIMDGVLDGDFVVGLVVDGRNDDGENVEIGITVGLIVGILVGIAVGTLVVGMTEGLVGMNVVGLEVGKNVGFEGLRVVGFTEGDFEGDAVEVAKMRVNLDFDLERLISCNEWANATRSSLFLKNGVIPSSNSVASARNNFSSNSSDIFQFLAYPNQIDVKMQSVMSIECIILRTFESPSH